MKSKLIISACVSVFILCAGCATPVVVGLGAGAGGAGVYSYMSGELKRTYPADLETCLAAAANALESMKIHVDQKQSDGVEANITAKRPDQTPVTVKAVSLTPRLTEVSVRTGVVGLWDRKVSELIHASIAQRLQ